MSRRQLILQKLVDARLGRLRVWAVKNIVRCPEGSVPLWALQGASCGGSAANMRLYELRAPLPNGCGIPIHKIELKYILDGTKHRLICYQLALDPEQIEELLDIPNTRLRMNLLATASLRLEEFIDDEGGPGGRAVRLVPVSPLHPPKVQPNLFPCL